MNRSYGGLSKDGKTYYVFANHRDGRMGLWGVPMAGGTPHLVVAADDPQSIFAAGPFSVTRDRVYLSVSEYASDIWVAKLRW